MHTPLLTTLVAGLGIAFILGLLAQRLRVSPIVGYLLAGVVIGPATPGIFADPEIAAELAEIGVILLMFGVGLHFSISDLLSVRRIALPGAIAQIVIATALGAGLALLLGWSLPSGLVFGLALSVASTVVLLRALQERRLLETDQGRIAVGWLIVEDLAMVLALVLIPALAGFESAPPGLAEEDPETPARASGVGLGSVLAAVGLTVLKVAAFVALMLIVGRRFIPWLLHLVAHSGSRELFRLSVLAIAIGIAFGAAELFDVSFALGAFFAGMVLAESALSQQAAQESLPFRDAFAVLFFVAVGMLFDPGIIVDRPLAVLATVAIIIVGKSLAAYAIVRAFGRSTRTALVISASLAQVGEFSFILAGLGVALNLLPEEGRDLILAGAIISILLNPVAFDILERWKGIGSPRPKPGTLAVPADETAEDEAAEILLPTALSSHAVIVGYGRVGGMAGEQLIAAGIPVVVVEENLDRVRELRERGIEALSGNGVRDEYLAAANIAGARWLLVAIPEAFEASAIVRHSRSLNPSLTIIARAHFDAEVDSLRGDGATVVIMGEREIARGMVEHVLNDKGGA
jgi:CPA2 family monovalent cation:H+ antiporter-2